MNRSRGQAFHAGNRGDLSLLGNTFSRRRVEAFLSSLAPDVSAATQNQSFNALQFFNRSVVGRRLGSIYALRANTKTRVLAELESGIPYPMKEVPLPSSPAPRVLALTREEVERLLKASIHSREAPLSPPHPRDAPPHRRLGNYPPALMPHTRIRASGLSAMKAGDLDLKTGNVEIKKRCHEVSGETREERSIPASPRTTLFESTSPARGQASP
jgi:integrase